MQGSFSHEWNVCPSVKHVHCDITKESCAHILIPHERSFILVLWQEEWLVGTSPSTQKFDGYWSTPFQIANFCSSCLPPLDNIRVMVIVWRLRGNIIRTAPCWVVWNNVHSQQHTYMSSSYRSSRLGMSPWDPYAVRRGGCLELKKR